MRTSIVPSSSIRSPHVVVMGNQKGGSGKSTFAMHIIVALLNAGKRVACFDLDLNQLTLTRYLVNRRAWAHEHGQDLLLPDHYPVTEEDPRPRRGEGLGLMQLLAQIKPSRPVHKEVVESGAVSHSADLQRFIAQLYQIGRERRHDFIIIDTPGGIQHLNLIAHGMADTLITPINDSFLDLDVLVAMERSDLEPQPSNYAKMVWRALDARRNVSGRATDWVVVRNRLEAVESNNHRQITRVLDVIQRTLDFRIAPGLHERPVYREFFAAGLTVLDRVEGFTSAAEANLSARGEVEDLMRQIGLTEHDGDVDPHPVPKIELQMASANDIDRTDP